MNLEWVHIIIGLVSAGFGAFGGLIAGVWRVSHIEQAIRDDFKTCIDETKHGIEIKVESLVGQFQDTFAALRQKINDVELESVKTFVHKGDFDDFRAEYREDMRDLKRSIAGISRTP